MDESISVKKLVKSYQVHNKPEGLKGSIASFFKRETKLVEAVKDISFTINQGEMVGFIGPNGAGKTTTLKMLSGILYPTSGEVNVLGYDPYKRNPEFLKQIALVMGQKNQLWSDLPPIDTFKLHKEIYEIPEERYRQILDELVNLLDLKEVLYRQTRRLSLGQKMKCEFVAALIHAPKVLFLDEPTIGLDVIVQKKVREFIKEYNKRYNSTVILTSHYMDDVKEICDRVIMINHGQLVFDGATEELIRKYAGHKILAPTFNSRVTEEELQEFGEVQSFNYPQATILVPREDTSKVAAMLLSKYDLDDLNINEPRLEDIIRVAYEG